MLTKLERAFYWPKVQHAVQMIYISDDR